MAANTIEFGKLRVFADHREALGQLALLLYREQDIGTHADDQGALELEALEAFFE